MWNLQSEEAGKRVYVNSITGSRCSLTVFYTDKKGNNWWQFDDLVTMPYTRHFAANKVAGLFALGFTKEDLDNHVLSLKNILRSDDKEKYEKAFSLVLDFESKAENATNPLRQPTALIGVYYLLNNELIDSFETSLQLKKMLILETDPQAYAFFLNKLNVDIENYMQRLANLSQIVLPEQKSLQEALV